MALVVDDVFLLIDQEPTLIHSKVVLVSELPVFVFEKYWLMSFSIVFKISHDLMRVEIPSFPPVRHWQLPEIFSRICDRHKHIFISVTTSYGPGFLVDQVATLID